VPAEVQPVSGAGGNGLNVGKITAGIAGVDNPNRYLAIVHRPVTQLPGAVGTPGPDGTVARHGHAVPLTAGRCPNGNSLSPAMAGSTKSEKEKKP
jgi:hypothetical protein